MMMDETHPITIDSGPINRGSEGVQSIQPQFNSGSPGIGDKALVRLEAIRKSNSTSGYVNSDLYRLLYKPSLYVTAYEGLKSKPGNMTPGIDDGTLDGFSMKTIENIIDDMRSERFSFSRSRRVYIPKAKGKTRPLGVPTPRDKVVQEALRMILEAIYDSPYGSSFSDESHGFRTGRGTHTALRSVRQNWNGVIWIIEGDIKSCFDAIPHDRLVNVLRRRISDQRFLNLIWKALKAGYMEFHTPVNSLIGTPQGSVLSPILSNIFLNEFDEYVQQKRKEIERGTKPRLSTEYRNITGKLERTRKRLESAPPKERAELLAHIRKLKSTLMKMNSTKLDGSYIRVKYVRYADDWMLGVNGPKAIADALKADCTSYFKRELGLTLSDEKTHIRHAKTETARFLGTCIRMNLGQTRVHKLTRHGRTFTKRVAGWQPVMEAPIPTIINRLCDRGICDKDGKPTSFSSLINFEDAQIIDTFNSIFLGYTNYYSFVDNFGDLSRVRFVIKYSLAKTLAHKHKSSTRKVFRHYGDPPSASTPTGKIVAFRDRIHWSKNPMRFLVSSERSPEANLSIHMRRMSRSLLSEACCICGSCDNVQMHHVRHIRTINKHLDPFTRKMAAINRKQIPVCSDCHVKIHAGEYDGMSLKRLTKRGKDHILAELGV
jgi:group II intron reverse transcriptase/maturase